MTNTVEGIALLALNPQDATSISVPRMTDTEEDVALPVLNHQDATSIFLTRMFDTQEDAALPVSSPQDKASRSCTRQTPCKKANCPICSEPILGTHHAQDLSQNLGITPNSKTSNQTSVAELGLGTFLFFFKFVR